MVKRAVLIGVNRYEQGTDLRGCVNDVIDMRNLLLRSYGFAKEGIDVLTDSHATKNGIESALAGLLEGASQGDVLLVHFAGHGSNVPDRNGDEADFRDEILCPTDLDWHDPLLDDWLRTLFDGTPDGVNLTVIMDCCHSGSNTRFTRPLDERATIARFLASPLDLRAAETGGALRGAVRGSWPKARRNADAGDVKDTGMPEVLMAACREYQTSADAFIDGDYHGAFTYALIHALNDAGGRISYRELHERTSELLDGRFDQVPQLEGRSAMFDHGFLEPL